MAAIKIKTAKQIEPKCYAYTTPEIERHEGWTKIGYTEQDDVKRRIQQQTQTADIKFNLEWAEKAVYEDGTGDSFKDKDFHAYLSKKTLKSCPIRSGSIFSPRNLLMNLCISVKPRHLGNLWGFAI